MFLLIAATNILTPPPDVRDDFGVSITTAGLIVGSYGLARLAVDLPAGRLADTFGPRRLSVIAIIVLLASSVLGLVAWSVEVLIAARIGSGLAVGVLAAVVLSALSSTATPVNRGKVMSLFHVANNTGIALYPMLGGLIGLAFGWRATFVLTAVLGRRRRGHPAAVAAAAGPQRVRQRGQGWGRCAAGPAWPRAADRDRGHQLRRRGQHDPSPRGAQHDPAAVRRDRPRPRRDLDRDRHRPHVDHRPAGGDAGRDAGRPARPAAGDHGRAGRGGGRRPGVHPDRRPADLPARGGGDRARRLLHELADRAAVGGRSADRTDEGAVRLSVLGRPGGPDRAGPARRHHGRRRRRRSAASICCGRGAILFSVPPSRPDWVARRPAAHASTPTSQPRSRHDPR